MRRMVCVVHWRGFARDACGGHVGLLAGLAIGGTPGVSVASVDRYPRSIDADLAAAGLSRGVLVVLRCRGRLGRFFLREASCLRHRVCSGAGANRAVAWAIALAGTAAGRGILAVHAR